MTGVENVDVCSDIREAALSHAIIIDKLLKYRLNSDTDRKLAGPDLSGCEHRGVISSMKFFWRPVGSCVPQGQGWSNYYLT